MEYQLKPSGHRHALLESSGRRTDWQYDAHYRLTQETISSDTAGPNGSAAYTYDAVGNRQTRTSTLGLLSNQSLSYNANDWLATDTYDSSGNTTASEGNADTYDFLNRLIRRITPTHALLDYEYNAEGILIAKTKNNNREEYHIDGNNPTGYAQVVETFFNTGSGLELTATHHYGHDLVSVHQTNGSTWQRHFYLYDGLGSVRALANEIGTVTDTYTYDAFGNLLHTTGSTTNPYRYTGERYDTDLGLYYLRARYLNTNTGRFWTMDSYEGRNSDPITLHKYLYANANPVMYVDPSGMVASLAEINMASIIAVSLGYALYSITPQGQAFNERLGYMIYALLFKSAMDSFNSTLMVSSQTDLDGITLLQSSKHTQEVLEGLLLNAEIHASKIGGFTANGSKDPRGHWEKEIRAALDRAKNLLKRLKGKTKEKFEKRIKDIEKNINS